MNKIEWDTKYSSWWDSMLFSIMQMKCLIYIFTDPWLAKNETSSRWDKQLEYFDLFLRKYASYTSSSNMHEWRNINTKNDIKGVLLFLAHPYSNYRDVKRGLLSSIMRMLHILISYLFLKKKYFYKSELPKRHYYT